MPDDELDDELDGLCDEDAQPPVTPDEDVDGIVMFADVAGDKEGIKRRKKELTELAASQEGQ